jgi:hypothetical protein
MRLKYISPDKLNPEQEILYGTMRDSIQRHLQGFITARSDGALIGPFNILLHFPELGNAVWQLFRVLADDARLPKTARETTILLTGAHFSSLYELYSHEAVAMHSGLPSETVAALAVGQCPAEFGRDGDIVFNIVSALLNGKQIPESTYAVAQKKFGQEGLAEIACTIGCYTTLASLLNIFDVALPGTELAD